MSFLFPEKLCNSSCSNPEKFVTGLTTGSIILAEPKSTAAPICQRNIRLQQETRRDRDFHRYRLLRAIHGFREFRLFPNEATFSILLWLERRQQRKRRNPAAVWTLSLRMSCCGCQRKCALQKEGLIGGALQLQPDVAPSVV
jgi:hypothetical protein